MFLPHIYFNEHGAFVAVQKYLTWDGYENYCFKNCVTTTQVRETIINRQL